MENKTKNNEKTISLGDLFFVIKKNWIVELCLILVVILAGGIYAKFFRKPYYVAKEDVIIKADINNSGSSYNNTTLAERYVETVSKLFKTGSIIRDANAIYYSKNPSAEEEGKRISSASVGVSSDETLIMTISYKDYDDVDALEKLSAVVAAVEKFSSATEVNEATGEVEKKYFKANVSVVPMSDDIECTRGSDTTKIIIIAVVLSIVVAFLYALFMYLVVDKIGSADRLESVTGKKNLITVNKRRTEEQDADEVDAVSLDLRKLSDTLIYMGDDKCKVYQIQSTISGEGKTSVSVNLAKALGESRRRTLIIDCDFYKPSVHKAFKLHRETGITDYFKGSKNFEEIVKHTVADNVDIITCGGRITNHTIFFTSPKFKEIIDKARNVYDFVILDGAPVKVSSDYINVTPHTDETILVVKADAVSARDVAASVSELEGCGANIVGTVFNFSDRSRKKEYYYYYGYNKEKKEK